MLNKYQISVVKEEMERVDTLRFQYGNLQSKAVSYYYHCNHYYQQCMIVLCRVKYSLICLTFSQTSRVIFLRMLRCSSKMSVHMPMIINQ